MINRFCRLLRTAAIGFAITVAFLFSMRVNTYAAETTYTPAVEAFESSEESNHSAYDAEKKSSFSYGGKSMGALTVSGGINDISTINGFTAYSANGPLIIGYDYDGSYQTGNKNEWNLISEDGKEVLGFSISKKIEKGTLIIQKSTNGTTWENATEQVQNVFTAKKLDRSNLYTITDDELKSGTYYRVIVAYGMKRLSATEERWWIIPDKETYDYIYCTEVYRFYACYGISTVSFRDVVSGNEISSGATVSNGFIIDKNGASSAVYLVKDGKTTTIVDKIRTSVYEPGEYSITVSTPLNQEFKYNITVTGGLSVRTLSPSVFENEKKGKYTEEHPVSGNPAYGFDSHTGITLAHNAADGIVAAKKNGFDAYGITGSNVYLFLELKNEEALADAGWEVVSDSWGKKSSELIANVPTGQVDSGAIIIQKSMDGLTWENEDLGRYAEGLYTTDYENHYGRKGAVLVYMPNGQEILKGVFVRILYAYEMKQASSKTDNRYIEKYEFYLCNNELGAITFHNLSAEGTLSDICKDYDDATAEIYRKAETMQTGAYTVSGFSIDTTLNPTVTYKVKRDGTNIAIPSNHEFTQEGKYTVDLTSAVGTHKEVEIFVDRMSTNEVLDFYFGEAFITGKRIFDEGDLAVYEGGLTSYQLNEVDLNHLPLGGEIKNLTTGEIVTITPSRTRKSSLITAPGTYEAVLSTNSGVSSGDNRIFTFRFKIIPKGTAPGPMVNQRSLKEYASSTISDSYPVYYALTYPSASTGYITLAFASKEAAMEYAYNYEKGMVEKQSDGSYRYTGSFLVSQKEKYNSAWDLTDAVNYFAEQAVQSGYFDLSNEFTSLTLTDSVIDNTANLRTLELNKSVTIFAPDQKGELTDLEALPIISPKPYSYLVPGRNGVVRKGVNDFKFVKDKYGSDSDTIQITDNTGKEYQIEYNRGVGEQLAAQNCPSGIVTITEKTVYGDTASYQAVYIAPAENTASITLSYYKDESEERQTFTQLNNTNGHFSHQKASKEFDYSPRDIVESIRASLP